MLPPVQSTHQVESPVYKTQRFPLNITNPLVGGGTFKVTHSLYLTLFSYLSLDFLPIQGDI